MRYSHLPQRFLGVVCAVWIIHAWGTCNAQSEAEPAPFISVPDFEHGRVLSFGQMTRLNIGATHRDGTPLADTGILFVAPDNGPSGTFVDAPTETSFFRTRTNDQGVASVTFVANEIRGAYLIDAIVEGTEAAVSFAMTNVAEPAQTVLEASTARRAIVDQILYNAVEDETLRLHGPVLLQSGTKVFSAARQNSLYPMAALDVDRPAWFFWIDEHPEANFGHPTRFILLDAAVSDPDVAVDATVIRQTWWPEIQPPSAEKSSSLRPPSSTNRSLLALSSDRAGDSSVLDRQLRPLGEDNDDVCAIVIYGPPDSTAENSAEAVSEFFTNVLNIPEDNIMTGTNLLGLSIPSSPDMLGQFIDRVKGKECKKLYLYISCHGYSGNNGSGLILGNSNDYDKSTKQDWLSHADLGEMLEPLAETNTEVCLIIDACYSATAIRYVQDRGVDGTIVTSAARDRESLTPLFAFGRSNKFTAALIECWQDPAADVDGDGTVTLDEAYAWVIKEGGSDATAGHPQIAEIDAEGGALPLPDVLIPQRRETVAVTIHRPPGAVGDINVTVRIVNRLFAYLSDPENPQHGPFGNMRRVVFREGTDSQTIHFTGLRDGETDYVARTIDDNRKEFQGRATIHIGSGYSIRPTRVPNGESRKVELQRHGRAPQTPRPTVVQFYAENPEVAGVEPAHVILQPGQTEVEFTIEGRKVSTARLIAFDPLYDLRTETHAVITGSPGDREPVITDILGLPGDLLTSLPLGNEDCTPLGDGSNCTVPDPPENIRALSYAVLNMSQSAADHLFSEVFPCGQTNQSFTTTQPLTDYLFSRGLPSGQDREVLTICSSTAPPQAGPYLFVNVRFGGDIPTDQNRYCQYGFVFDADGLPENNFIPEPPFWNDYYGFADTAFQVTYSPEQGWLAQAVDMRNGVFTPRDSNARFVIVENEIATFIPMSEFPTPNPACRVTVHCHHGDYGFAGGPWSGDYYPRVYDPLLPTADSVIELGDILGPPQI